MNNFVFRNRNSIVQEHVLPTSFQVQNLNLHLALEFLLEHAVLMCVDVAIKYVPGVVMAKVVQILLAGTQVTVAPYVAMAVTLLKEYSLMVPVTDKVGSYQTQVKMKDYPVIVVPSDLLTA